MFAVSRKIFIIASPGRSVRRRHPKKTPVDG